LRPFGLALAGAVLAVAATWLALASVVPPAVGFAAYVGVAAVIAASVWSFRLARRSADCLDEMMLEARQRAQRGSPALRVALGVAAAVGLYGLYWATSTFVPH
jgi:hypothetical protein